MIDSWQQGNYIPNRNQSGTKSSSEFLEILRQAKAPDHVWSTEYDFDTNQIILHEMTDGKIVKHACVAFVDMDYEDYQISRLDFAEVLPDLYKKTGHMW